jgi:hypothetical protein
VKVSVPFLEIISIEMMKLLIYDDRLIFVPGDQSKKFHKESVYLPPLRRLMIFLCIKRLLPSNYSMLDMDHFCTVTTLLSPANQIVSFSSAL